MAFAIKVDEDLPRAAVDLLCKHGYDAISVIDQQMGGWKDSFLWKAIQKENRFLVTADKGFANLRTYPPGKHAGILLLRPDEDGVPPIIDLLKKVLVLYKLTDLAGNITVATPRAIRTRKS
jgi:predicted nuclease of predicted toxin-antitoxin system